MGEDMDFEFDVVENAQPSGSEGGQCGKVRARCQQGISATGKNLGFAGAGRSLKF
jgi:hypothetical protein